MAKKFFFSEKQRPWGEKSRKKVTEDFLKKMENKNWDLKFRKKQNEKAKKTN